MTTNPNLPIACDLTAIPRELREQHINEGLRVFDAVEAVQELPAGYAFRFGNAPDIFMRVARFVENERRCCPFYNFEIEVTPNGGPLWLRLTGGEGVKEFEQALFSDANATLRRYFTNLGPAINLGPGA